MEFKRVLIVGGSEDYVGAPYLAAIAALRSGAGSVLIMTPEKVAWAINTLSPDLMTRKLPGSFLTTGHRSAIEEKLATADILLIGNGLGVHPETKALVAHLIQWPGLKVIDADALKALDKPVENAILTPNEGEWHYLESRSADLIEKNVLVKKSAQTEIHSAEKNETVSVNPSLMRAGMGDVLAGLCAGYLAQGYGLFEAAHLACTTGNDAAQILTEKKQGYYFLASDLADEIQKVSRYS